MASTSWTGLLTGSSTPLLASGDVIAFVDVSDTTQSPQGSLVKGTLTQFFAAIPVPIVVTSASANALAVGANGATNPAFTVDASTASQVAGLKVTGAATGGTVAVVVTDSGSNANLTVNAKGSGTIGIGSVSTGAVTITPATTLSATLTSSAVSGAQHKFVAAANGTYGTATYLDWYRADGTTRRAIVGFDSNNAQTFTFATYEAGDSFQFLTDNATQALEINSSRLAFYKTLLSTVAVATPSALSATQWTAFASTVSGAALMGYGTTNDVALMNRAGTVCLGIGPNTTVVNIPGSLSVTGAITGGSFGGVTMSGGAVSGITTLAGTGAISGFTTLGLSGTITSTVTSGNVLLGASGGSNALYVNLQNTNGIALFGVNDSSGAAVSMTGGTAYSAFVGSFASRSLDIVTNSAVRLSVSSSGAFDFKSNTVTGLGNIGFYGTAATAKQAATGSRGGNAALASLLTALATIGLITDSTSA